MPMDFDSWVFPDPAERVARESGPDSSSKWEEISYERVLDMLIDVFCVRSVWRRGEGMR